VKAGSAKGLVLTHPLSLSLTLAISPTCFLLHCRPYLTCRDSPVRQMDELSKTPSSLSASFTLSVYLSGKQMPIKARQSNRVAPYTHATNKDSTRCAKTSRDWKQTNTNTWAHLGWLTINLASIQGWDHGPLPLLFFLFWLCCCSQNSVEQHGWVGLKQAPPPQLTCFNI